MKQIVALILFVVFLISVLGLTVRGISGNPSSGNFNNVEWKDEGPLELSPERGRFALLYSFVENGSFIFDLPIARFATPDLGYKDGKFVSLFAPGVSFIVIPGYLIGKAFGLSQLGVFLNIAFFALLNVFLIRAIAIRLGVSPIAAILAGITFIFATPAFAYAVSLYQHHISTFLLLLSIYMLIHWKGLLATAGVWFLFAISISVDYPNFFFMIPVLIYAGWRLASVTLEDNKTVFRLRILGVFTFLTMILPLAFFFWFNTVSYGNPFQLSGTVDAVKVIDDAGNPILPDKTKQQNPSERSATEFFKTRHQINGMYILLLSPDRGIIVYTPVILFGLAGLFFLYKKHPVAPLLIGVVGMNFLLYSMWGDPYGGWAFGSRYLIPSYAILSIGLAYFLHMYRKNIVLLILFFLVFLYSVSINTLGAITSSRNPPKVEAVALSQLSGKDEKYTFERNWQYLMVNKSKSYIWQTYARYYLNTQQYYVILVSLIGIPSILLILILATQKEKRTT